MMYDAMLRKPDPNKPDPSKPNPNKITRPQRLWARALAGAGALCMSAALSACTVHTAQPAQPVYTEPAPGPAAPAPAPSGEPAPGPAAPAAPAPSGLREYPPVSCRGNQDIELRGVSIQSPDVAVKVVGNCDVVIEGSYIAGGDAGISITGNGEVSIMDSTVEGGRDAFRITGNGDIKARNTRFAGGRSITGNGGFEDLGGNQWQ